MDRITETLRGCRRIAVQVDDEALSEVAEHDRWVVQGFHARHHSRAACCAGKKRYGEEAAHRAARVLNWAQGEDVHAYACPHGRHWHVGHQPVTRTNRADLLGA